MELRQLRYFVAVADELHFGRAAQKLHMSQPPLSLQVSRLEQELGVMLFERTTRSVALTPAGRHLRERAIRILGDVDEACAEVREFGDGFAGRLTVGFVSSASYTVLPGVVQLFRTRRSNVELSPVPLTSGEQRERLHEGTIDIGIVRDERPRASADAHLGPSELTAEVVFEEHLVACLPVDHPLAIRDRVTTDEISRVPMITYPRALMPGYVDRVAAALGEAAGNVVIAEEVIHQETALGFVAAGAGMSILPESIRQLVPPSIAVVPLAGSPTTQLLAMRRAHRPRSAASDAFIACLHETAQHLLPVSAAA